MERKRVNSSKLRSVGYDEKTMTLEVEMSNGQIYQYVKVYPEVYRRFMAAPNPDGILRRQDRRGVHRAAGIIRAHRGLSAVLTMEAERINQIASTLAGLQTQSAELRRYL